jgi:bifunctional DNA-binding transcriptional regulator/antitoxin component of YhaV-PrlF toxin-antitoxin module
MPITLKTKSQLVVPSGVQRKAGLKAGDRAVGSYQNRGDHRLD